MGNQAKVTSLDALDSLRAALIIFLGKARRSLDDANDEARLTRMWLQHDRVVHWENEIRKRSRALDQAEQEFMTARLVKNNQSAMMARRAAVEKAKRALDEADGKLRRVKQWAQNFDSASDPIVKRLESMKQFLDEDMPKAIAYIVSIQRTLAAYAEGPPPEEMQAPVAAPAVNAEAETQTAANENP